MPRSIITILNWRVNHGLRYLYTKYQLNNNLIYLNLALQFGSFFRDGIYKRSFNKFFRESLIFSDLFVFDSSVGLFPMNLDLCTLAIV